MGDTEMLNHMEMQANDVTDEYEPGELRSTAPSDVSDIYGTVWTTTHGFWIAMGGFHQYSGDTPTVYLTPTHVLTLIADGLLIPPSEEDIKDRSKGDSFSKVIVLIQTLWFMTQCITRYMEHLPITELEIATVAYTIPILGIYICWWSKPLGVSQPIQIPSRYLNLSADTKEYWLPRLTNSIFGQFLVYGAMCIEG